jgi:hypothetical protein
MPTGLKGWEKALGETGTLPGASAECPNIGKLNETRSLVGCPPPEALDAGGNLITMPM